MDLSIKTIPELTATASRRWPEQEAIRCEIGTRSISFRDLEEQSTALAQVLIHRGIRPGEVVAVMLPNCLEFPLLWLAIVKAGAAMAPINVRYQEADRNHVLTHSGASAFIAGNEHIDAIRQAPTMAPDLRWTALVSSLCREAEHTTSAELPLAFPHSTANIQYTSGTTGMPKGCILSHRYWIEFGMCFISSGPRLKSDDRILTAQPFSYADPQWNVMASLLSGAALTILNKFSPSQFWKTICENETSFFYCLGAMPGLLLQVPPSEYEQRHRVRQVLCSGIPINLHRELESRFRCPWFEAFGTTETGGDLLIDHDDQAVATGAIGRPLPNKEARAVGTDGRPVPCGEIGELAIRGTGMMDGYHNDPNATERAFRAGFYMTGDLVRQDSTGLFYHVGRIKDMIRRGGENISATEVEAVIMCHPAVSLAACIPVPDALRGEEVKAFVVLKAAKDLDLPSMQELFDFVSQRLARFKVPRYWDAVKTLPMTPSERVEKGNLKSSETQPPRGIDFAVPHS
jgi:crotonobetaine/carnitine-CoA ligase